MNTGFQDSFNLAWKLALITRGIGDPEALLKSYCEERQPVADQVLHMSNRLSKVMTMDSSLVKRFLRDFFTPLFSSLVIIPRFCKMTALQPFVKKKVVSSMSQLTITYAESPLVRKSSASVLPGNRLPYHVLEDRADFRELSTQKILMEGALHHLFMLSKPWESMSVVVEKITAGFPGLIRLHSVSSEAELPGPLEGATFWRDKSGKMLEEFGVHHGNLLVLVRPDGYVEFSGHANEYQQMIDHLKTYIKL